MQWTSTRCLRIIGAVKDIGIQAVRNATVHGMDPAEARAWPPGNLARAHNSPVWRCRGCHGLQAHRRR